MSRALPEMVRERRQPPPWVRRHNPSVSYAAESIIRHCLEPDPIRRYQTAAELHEDLERHRDDEPLRYAPEPSLRERMGKWVRRHPASSKTLIGMACCFTLVMLGFYWLQDVRHKRQEAALGVRNEVRNILQEFRELPYEGPEVDPVRLSQLVEVGQRTMKRALRRYQVESNPAWRESNLIRYLPSSYQAQLPGEIVELAVLIAQEAYCLARISKRTQSPEQPLDPASPVPAQASRSTASWRESAQVALRFNDLALMVHGDSRLPRALLVQRAEVLDLLDRKKEAEELRRQAKNTPLTGIQDPKETSLSGVQEHCLLAWMLLLDRRPEEALPFLEQARRLVEADRHRPQDANAFWTYYLLGMVHAALDNPSEAAGAFSTCLAIDHGASGSTITAG